MCRDGREDGEPLVGQDFRRLFLAHRRELLAFLTRKLRDAETAADLTQETFLRFVEQGRSGSSALVTHERSYLYRIAGNLVVDYVRQRRRDLTDVYPDEELTALPDEAPSPERVALGKGELERLRDAIRQLPDRTQRVFVLARLEGLTYREVAERLGISESSVQKHLAIAIQHAMHALRDR